MLKSYELLYIVHPDLEGTTEKVTDKVAKFIDKAEGKITSQEDWGKRKMAYSISRNDFGVYILVEFDAESTKLVEIERNLRLSEEIMRSMIVAIPEEKQAKPEKPKAKKAEAEAVSEEKEEKEVPVTAEAPGSDDTDMEKTKAKAAKKEKAETVEKPAKAEKPKKTTEKKEVKAKADETSTSSEQDEKKRLKALDEKLEEILGEDKDK